jgi:hypothetical protein
MATINHGGSKMLSHKRSVMRTLLLAATAATMFIGVADARNGIPVQSGKGSVCRIESVPTPANANTLNPYARYVFDGSVQAYVPPVPPGYRGPTRMVQQEVCTPA